MYYGNSETLPALANGTYRELEEDDYILGNDGLKEIPRNIYSNTKLVSS